MWNLRTFLAFTGLALTLSAAANVPAEPVSNVYIEGGQYTAVLAQATQDWRLLPKDGVDIAVSAAGTADCRGRGTLPEGIWLVTSDADGQPVLAAPSTTALPAGHPEQVALRACGETAEGPYVAAPQGLIDWIVYNTGAIYVED